MTIDTAPLGNVPATDDLEKLEALVADHQMYRSLRPAQVQQIKGQLDRGERIHWATRPNPWYFMSGRFTNGRSMAVGFGFIGVIILAIAILAGILGESRGSLISAVVGLVMVFPMVAEYFRARRSFYAITERRLLMIDLRRVKTVFSIGLDILENVVASESPTKIHEIPEMEMFGIDNSQLVHQLIQGLLARQKTNPERERSHIAAPG